MVVVMSHQHVNDHVYMKISLISLISLISIRYKRIQFGVRSQCPRHGLGLGTQLVGRLATAGFPAGIKPADEH